MKAGELLQFQLLQMFNPMNSNGGANGVGGKPMDMKNNLYMFIIQTISMFLMTIIEQISAAVPTLVKDWKKTYVDKQIENTLANITTKKEVLSDVSINLGKKHDQNTVIIIRKWSSAEEKSGGNKNVLDEGDESKEIADALLSHIASAENVPTLQLIQSSQFIVNYKDKPIEILPNIYIKIDEFQMDSETLKMKHLVLRVTSNAYNTRHIRETLQNLRRQWIADQQNQLGEKLWYFEQRVRAGRSVAFGDQENNSERMRLEKVLNAPPVIQYEMRPFYSNKSFDNLFGKEARMVRDRIDFFMKDPEWYAQKGLPYQLGILLSGKPGSGKTAILRAIANRTKRHIINLKLNNLATATQLKNIFYNDYISVCGDDESIKKLLIPADKRIYVFEEIDTIGELVQERSLRFDANKSVLQDELTLGDILQILDGTIEIPGRILVMTSNYPERLDRALLRPGRIDIKVDFGFATSETISEVVRGMLELTIPPDKLPNEKLTVAEVLNIVFTFIHYKGESIENDIVIRMFDRVQELQRENEKLVEMKQEMEKKQEIEKKQVDAMDSMQHDSNKSSVKKRSSRSSRGSKGVKRIPKQSEKSTCEKDRQVREQVEREQQNEDPKLSGPSLNPEDLRSQFTSLSELEETGSEQSTSEERENESETESEIETETHRPRSQFHQQSQEIPKLSTLQGYSPFDGWGSTSVNGGGMSSTDSSMPSFWLQDTGIPSNVN